MSSTEHDQTLFELELSLMKPDVRRNPQKLGVLLDNNFVEVGTGGATFSKDAIISALASEVAREFKTHDMKSMQLAPDVVLVTYQATITEKATGQAIKSLRSSIWRQSHDRWQMVFHQGTRVE